MDYISRYKKRTKANPDRASSDFINEALNKISIQLLKGGDLSEETYDAVLIMKYRDGVDTAILYTYANDGIEAGDCIFKKGAREQNDLYYLVAEEEGRVDGSQTIRVFRTQEANVNLVINKQKYPAAVTTSVRNQTIQGSRDSITAEQKVAKITVPKSYELKLNDTLEITNIRTDAKYSESWRIDGKDDITSPGMTYITAIQVASDNSTDQETNKDRGLTPGARHTFKTEGGYFKTDIDIHVVSRTAEKVIVVLPNKNITFTVSLKSNGEIINTKVKVGD